MTAGGGATVIVSLIAARATIAPLAIAIARGTAMTGDTTAATTAHETAIIAGARAISIARGIAIIDGTTAATAAIVGKQPPGLSADQFMESAGDSRTP
jgi:hypothetical protein